VRIALGWTPPGKAGRVLADNGCVAWDYTSYADYKRALQELRRTGIAPKVVLPFAAQPGDSVVIDDKEYVLLAAVTDEGPVAGPIEPEESAILGYLARRVN
jgi:hypothetical protein